ncbi:gamma carbonic anhydrase family protein [bacterium]|nr:MAG: gamma carbonic anhydrase family protein [bacterium]
MVNLLPFKTNLPRLGERVFIAPSALLIGDVSVGVDSSFWFQSVARGDVNYIRIGDRTNIQDSSTLHVTTDKYPLYIGNGVTVGHGVIAHGCRVEDDCLLGIGSRILDGAVIESGTIIGAGSLVTQGTRIPSGILAMGIPAKPIRPLEDDEKMLITRTAKHYVKLKDTYLKTDV